MLIHERYVRRVTAVRQLLLAQKQTLNECSGEASSCRAGDGVWLQAYQRCAERPRVVNDARNSSHCTVFCRPHFDQGGPRTPLATVQRSLLAVHALFWDEYTAQCPALALHGSRSAQLSSCCLPSFVRLAVDWSRESSCWHRSQIPTSVDALIYTNNLSHEQCWTAGLLQPLAAALLTDDRCGTATDAIN